MKKKISEKDQSSHKLCELIMYVESFISIIQSDSHWN